MSKWKEILLGEVIEVVNGYAFKSTDFLENKIDNSLPVIKIKNVANGDVHLNGCQFHKYEQKLERFVVESGDVLLALTGNHPEVMTQVVGEASRYKLSEKAFLNQRVAKVLPKNARELNTDFLYYFLKDDNTHDYLASQSTGSANQANISKVDIESIPLNLPPLPEQTAIAEVLSSLDDKIDLLHRQNKTLEQLAATLFRQWFVEEAEECWEIGNVNDLVKIQSGFAFKSSDFSDDGIYRIITIKNVQDGFLDSSKSDFLNSIPRNMPEHCSLRIGDILLSLTGNVGRCCLVDNNNLLLNQRVAKLKQLNERDWAFTYIMFRQTSMRKTLEELAKGTAQANLSPIEMGSLDIQIPPANKLEHFSNEATPLIKKVLNNKIQIRTLTKLRDTLLPKLMSGEVRVNQINN